MGFETPTKLTRGSHPSLPYTLMAAFMADLRARDAVAARALEFLILTNVRTDAVLKAAWDEFDLDQALWTVPLANLKDRMHRKEGFRVPLVARAVEIVRHLQEGRVSRFIFPGQARGKPLSNMALLTLLKRMNSGAEKNWIDPASGRRITAHGFPGDLQDLGRGGRDLPPCSNRTGDGASGRHPGRTGLPPDGRPRQAETAYGHLGAVVRARIIIECGSIGAGKFLIRVPPVIR